MIPPVAPGHSPVNSTLPPTNDDLAGMENAVKGGYAKGL